MLPKEELLRNIDELYTAYLSAESQRKQSEAARTISEAERIRLRSLNSALRNEIAKLPKPREISALEKKLSERPTSAESKIDNERLRAENESIRAENDAQK